MLRDERLKIDFFATRCIIETNGYHLALPLIWIEQIDNVDNMCGWRRYRAIGRCQFANFIPQKRHAVMANAPFYVLFCQNG